MKDVDQQLIFETYNNHLERQQKIAYLRENFEDGAGGGFGDKKDSDSKSDSDSGSKSDSDSDSKSDSKSDSDSDSDSKSDSDSDSKSDTDSDSKSDSSSSSKSSSSSSSSKPSSSNKSSSGETRVEKGKMSEDELDTELDALMAKKAKIESLFKDNSIDEEVAHQALDKIKGITNQLVAKFI
jgi:hypothetical protein